MMKSDNQIRKTSTRLRMMLRTSLSMHIMPVLLAFGFVFLAEQNIRVAHETTSKSEAITTAPSSEQVTAHIQDASTFAGASSQSLALLNPSNIQHYVTIYQVARLAINVIR